LENSDVVNKYIKDLTGGKGFGERFKYEFKRFVNSIPAVGELLGEKISISPAKELDVARSRVNEIIKSGRKYPLTTAFDPMYKKYYKDLEDARKKYETTYDNFKRVLSDITTRGLKPIQIKELFDTEEFKKGFELMVLLEPKLQVKGIKGKVDWKDVLGTEILQRIHPETTFDFAAPLTKELFRESKLLERSGKAFAGDVVLFTENVNKSLQMAGITLSKGLGVSGRQGVLKFKEDIGWVIEYVSREFRTVEQVPFEDVANFVDAIFPTRLIEGRLTQNLSSLEEFISGAAAGMTDISTAEFGKAFKLSERFFSQIPTETLLQTTKGWDYLTKSYGEMGYKGANISRSVETPFSERTKRYDEWMREHWIKPMSQLEMMKEPLEKRAIAGQDPGVAMTEDFQELVDVLKNNSVVIQYRSVLEDLGKTLNENNRVLKENIALENLRNKAVLQTSGLLKGLPEHLEDVNFGIRNIGKLTLQQSILYREKSLPENERVFTKEREEYRKADIGRASAIRDLEAIEKSKVYLEELRQQAKELGTAMTTEELKASVEEVSKLNTDPLPMIYDATKQISDHTGEGGPIASKLDELLARSGDPKAQIRVFDVGLKNIESMAAAMSKRIQSPEDRSPFDVELAFTYLKKLRDFYEETGQEPLAEAVNTNLEKLISQLISRYGFTTAMNKAVVGGSLTGFAKEPQSYIPRVTDFLEDLSMIASPFTKNILLRGGGGLTREEFMQKGMGVYDVRQLIQALDQYTIDTSKSQTEMQAFLLDLRKKLYVAGGATVLAAGGLAATGVGAPAALPVGAAGLAISGAGGLMGQPEIPDIIKKVGMMGPLSPVLGMPMKMGISTDWETPRERLLGSDEFKALEKSLTEQKTYSITTSKTLQRLFNSYAAYNDIFRRASNREVKYFDVQIDLLKKQRADIVEKLDSGSIPEEEANKHMAALDKNIGKLAVERKEAIATSEKRATKEAIGLISTASISLSKALGVSERKIDLLGESVAGAIVAWEAWSAMTGEEMPEALKNLGEKLKEGGSKFTKAAPEWFKEAAYKTSKFFDTGLGEAVNRAEEFMKQEGKPFYSKEESEQIKAMKELQVTEKDLKDRSREGLKEYKKGDVENLDVNKQMLNEQKSQTDILLGVHEALRLLYEQRKKEVGEGGILDWIKLPKGEEERKILTGKLTEITKGLIESGELPKKIRSIEDMGQTMIGPGGKWEPGQAERASEEALKRIIAELLRLRKANREDLRSMGVKFERSESRTKEQTSRTDEQTKASKDQKSASEEQLSYSKQLARKIDAIKVDRLREGDIGTKIRDALAPAILATSANYLAELQAFGAELGEYEDKAKNMSELVFKLIDKFPKEVDAAVMRLKKAEIEKAEAMKVATTPKEIRNIAVDTDKAYKEVGEYLVTLAKKASEDIEGFGSVMSKAPEKMGIITAAETILRSMDEFRIRLWSSISDFVTDMKHNTELVGTMKGMPKYTEISAGKALWELTPTESLMKHGGEAYQKLYEEYQILMMYRSNLIEQLKASKRALIEGTEGVPGLSSLNIEKEPYTKVVDNTKKRIEFLRENSRELLSAFRKGEYTSDAPPFSTFSPKTSADKFYEDVSLINRKVIKSLKALNAVNIKKEIDVWTNWTKEAERWQESGFPEPKKGILSRSWSGFKEPFVDIFGDKEEEKIVSPIDTVKRKIEGLKQSLENLPPDLQETANAVVELDRIEKEITNVTTLRNESEKKLRRELENTNTMLEKTANLFASGLQISSLITQVESMSNSFRVASEMAKISSAAIDKLPGGSHPMAMQYPTTDILEKASMAGMSPQEAFRLTKLQQQMLTQGTGIGGTVKPRDLMRMQQEQQIDMVRYREGKDLNTIRQEYQDVQNLLKNAISARERASAMGQGGEEFIPGLDAIIKELTDIFEAKATGGKIIVPTEYGSLLEQRKELAEKIGDVSLPEEDRLQYKRRYEEVRERIAAMSEEEKAYASKYVRPDVSGVAESLRDMLQEINKEKTEFDLAPVVEGLKSGSLQVVDAISAGVTTLVKSLTFFRSEKQAEEAGSMFMGQWAQAEAPEGKTFQKRIKKHHQEKLLAGL